MLFWNFLAFSMIQRMLAIWCLVPLPFLKPSLNIWKFMVNILLKPGLENFEHYFASIWDECNCAVVWAFSGIAFLHNWNEDFSSSLAAAEFSKFTGILSAALSQHHLLRFEIAQLEFCHLLDWRWYSCTSTAKTGNDFQLSDTSALMQVIPFL